MNLNKGLLIIFSLWVLAACGGGGGSGSDSGGSSDSNTQATNNSIPSITGGSVQSADKVVTIQAIASSFMVDSINFKITQTSLPNTYIDVDGFGSVLQKSGIYEIDPSDPKYLTSSANLTFKYSNVTDTRAIGVAYYSESLKKWFRVSNPIIDSTNQTISIQTSHFSKWALFDYYSVNVYKYFNSNDYDIPSFGDIDSLFTPAKDGLSLVNWGTRANGGDCFAFTILADWYFDKGKALNNNISANNQFGVEAFPLISGLMNLAIPVNNFNNATILSATSSTKKIVDMMWPSHDISQPAKPVIFNVGDGSAGHSLLVYKYDSKNKQFYYYDPNYPQMVKSFFHNVDGSLLPFEFVPQHTAYKFKLTKWTDVVSADQMVAFWNCYTKGQSCTSTDIPSALPFVLLKNINGAIDNNNLVTITGNLDGYYNTSPSTFKTPSIIVYEAYQGTHKSIQLTSLKFNGSNFTLTFPLNSLVDKTKISLNLHFYSATNYNSNSTIWGAEFYSFTPIFAPTINTQPTSQTITDSQDANFIVTPSGTPPFTYQWKYSIDSGKTWLNVSNGIGGTTASYTTPAVAVIDNGTLFSVVVTNSAGSVTSVGALLTVTAIPAVTKITPQSAYKNQAITFTITGINLPTTALMVVPWANCSTPTNRTSTGFTQVCTPTISGNNQVVIKTSSTGTVIDSKNYVSVNDYVPTISCSGQTSYLQNRGLSFYTSYDYSWKLSWTFNANYNQNAILNWGINYNNSNDWSWTSSGSLRVRMYAVNANSNTYPLGVYYPDFNSSSSNVRGTAYSADQLTNFSWADGLTYNASITSPPAGEYCVDAYLDEYTTSGYQAVFWSRSTQPAVVQ